MGVRSGTLTFTRFHTLGKLPKDLRKRFLEAVRLRAFTPLKPEDEALEASGWCAMERPFDLELDAAKVFHDSYVLLGFRVDRYRIPGALLKSQIADEEARMLSRGTRNRLSRNEKLEVKDRVVARLRKKVIPNSKAIDMAWNLDAGTVLFFTHSKRTLGDFSALFEKTFGLALVEDSPYTAAMRADLAKPQASLLASVEPLSFSSGRKQLGRAPRKTETEPEAVIAPPAEGDDVLERIETTRFLGADFLLWLWLRAELVSSEITLPEVGKLEAWLDNQLTLQSDIDPNERVTVRGAAPSGSAEAREAVHNQKFPVRARIALRNEERDFACVLVAHRFALAGATIPAVLTKDSDDAFVERMTLVDRLLFTLDRLYAAFLNERLSATWKLGWEPAIVCWAEEESIPTTVLAELSKQQRGRRKSVK